MRRKTDLGMPRKLTKLADWPAVGARVAFKHDGRWIEGVVTGSGTEAVVVNAYTGRLLTFWAKTKGREVWFETFNKGRVLYGAGE